MAPLQHLQLFFHGREDLNSIAAKSRGAADGSVGRGKREPGDLQRVSGACPTPRGTGRWQAWPSDPVLPLTLTLTRSAPLWLQVGKLRERLQEAKLEREQEQRRHTAYISELRAKLHEEKTKELQALREVLIRQHEQEAARTAKIKEGELQRLQATLNVLRDGAADKVKTALLAEARDEARRAFDGERLRLQQEILELKSARKQAEEALSNCMQADKTKAAELRAAYQAHQDEVHRIKRECERDIRRLVRAPPPCPAHPALPHAHATLPAHPHPVLVHTLVLPALAHPPCAHARTRSWFRARAHPLHK